MEVSNALKSETTVYAMFDVLPISIYYKQQLLLVSLLHDDVKPCGT